MPHCCRRGTAAPDCKDAITKWQGAAVQKLLPSQVGVGVQGATDLVSHLARALLQQSVCLQIDFSNAFNTIDRTSMLNRVHSLCPDLAPWCHWCYGAPKPLFSAQNFDNIPSTCGVQQGDPLGPLLFSIGLSLVTESIARFQALYQCGTLMMGLSSVKTLGSSIKPLN